MSSLLIRSFVILISALVFSGCFEKQKDIRDSRRSITTKTIDMIASDLKQFKKLCGTYPKEGEWFNELSSSEGCKIDSDKLMLPYLKDKPVTDSWNNQVQYKLVNDGVKLISFGADGKAGGDGDNKDITLEINAK